MSHDLMAGMLWAALLLVGVPLSIGIGVFVMLFRRRHQSDDDALDRG